MTVQEEIERATVFGQKVENLIVNKGSVKLGDTGDRDKLLLAYWSLIFDYDKGILALMRPQFYGPAFALMRPTVEAVIRAHVVLMGSDEEITRIKDDTFHVNFRTIGADIDKAFGLQGFFHKFLNGNGDGKRLGALHSFTHSGLSQLGRRFKRGDLQAHYQDGEIIEVIRTSSTSAYLATNLVVKHFKFEAESEEVDRLFMEWGTRQEAPQRAKS
jgi:hypothetical protein